MVLSRCFPLCLAGLLLAVVTGCPPVAPQAGDTRSFDGIQFQWCPPGTFLMGSLSREPGSSSDETLHQVTLTKGFWMSTYEITQAQWDAVMEDDPSTFPGANLPVESMSWFSAKDFVAAMNAKANGDAYRLPTEAEWEYAYRAGTTTRFYWGADKHETQIGNYAWYVGNTNFQTYPVGQKLPNPWGLYDIAGNVAEWCEDWYSEYPAGPVTDPVATSDSDNRVVRGGGWALLPLNQRAATRRNSAGEYWYYDVGLRLVRSAD